MTDEAKLSVTSAARHGLSITAQLTVLYAVVSFAVLALVIFIVYDTMLNNMNRTDQKFVADKIHVLRSLLAEHADYPDSLEEEVEWEKIPSHLSYYAYYSRITDAKGSTLLETPGFNRLLSHARFLPATIIRGDKVPIVRWKAPDGCAYLLGSARGQVGAIGGERRLIYVALDVTPEHAVIVRFQKQMAMILVLGVLLSTGIGAVVSWRGMRPLEEIARTAQQITASRLHERIDPRQWPRELAALAGAFDQMLDRLEESFTRLSQFSADLAHELRTPINNLMGETEVTLSRTRSADEYRQTLESAMEEFDRLSRMIESMLFLARADNKCQPVNARTICVRTEMESVCEFYDSVAQEKGVTLICEGEAQLRVDPTLFRRALSNLLANALSHTLAGGRVRVRVWQAADGSVEVCVEDTGYGIEEKDLPRVFDRFYRADISRSAENVGTGLGLAIVKSIMETHGGKASIHSRVGLGTTVILTFPAE